MGSQEQSPPSAQQSATSGNANSGTSTSAGGGPVRSALRGQDLDVQMAMLAPRDVQHRESTGAAPAAPQGEARSGRVQLRSVQRVVPSDTPPVPTTTDVPTTESTTDTPVVDPAVALAQKKADVANVTTPPIKQASDDPTTSLNANGSAFENLKSDSPDPIMLKDRVITLTQEYLALQEPSEAVKQAKLELIRSTFEELRAAMKSARGEDDSLVAMRVDFEKYIGGKANGEWTEGTTCIDAMVNSAKTMIADKQGAATAGAATVDERLAGLPEETKATIGNTIGGPVNIGFAGNVGFSFQAILDALNGGGPVQRAQALINFADNYLIPGVLEGAGPVFDAAQANLAQIDPELNLAKMVEQAKALNNPKAAKKFLLSNPVFLEKIKAYGLEAEELNDERAEENGGALNKDAVLEGMDSKIPQQPIELCTETELDFIAGEIRKNDLFKMAEYRTQVGKEAKVSYLISAGVRTSKPAGAAVDATSTVVGEKGITAMNEITGENFRFIEGKLENIVDPRHSWIVNANEAQMPLKAGISGTTARFVGTANMLGGTPNGAVVAMLGHLQAIEAHSFWEIVDAAGIGMSAGSYVPFAPNDGGMRSAASSFLDEKGLGALGSMDKDNAKKVLLGEKAAG